MLQAINLSEIRGPSMHGARLFLTSPNTFPTNAGVSVGD